jgi:trk system potassium uptake protein TrkA
LNIHSKESIIVEIDKTRYKELSSKGINTCLSDGLDPMTFDRLKIKGSNYVVVDTGSDELNVRICEMLRKEYNHDKIISLTNNREVEQKFKTLDVETIDVRRVMATTIENLIVRPTTYHALVETFENFNVEEILIINPLIEGRKVREISLHKDAILILLKRGTYMFIPHEETYLKTGDILHILGTDSALESTREILA